MAKYIKSIFQPSEKRSTIVYEAEMEDDVDPSIRRTFSMSRSGRLKQANKKRNAVTMEHYGEDYQKPEKPRSVEYHVKSPAKSETKTDSVDRRRSADTVKLGDKESTNVNTTSKQVETTNIENRRHSAETGVLETEIDNAFEIIDQT